MSNNIIEEICFICDVKDEINDCINRKEIAQVVKEYKLYDSSFNLANIAKMDYLSSVDVLDAINANPNSLLIQNYYNQIVKCEKDFSKYDKQDYLTWLNEKNSVYLLDNCSIDFNQNLINQLDYIIDHYEENDKPDEFITFFNQMDKNQIINANKAPTSFIIKHDDLYNR